MASPNLTDIIATTLEHRGKEIADNVTNNNASLFTLDKGGRVKKAPGGRIIYEPLSFQENSNGGWYSGYDTLPVAATELLTGAEYNWKQYAVPVVISGLEMLQNSGKEALFDLLEEKITVSEATMANDINEGMLSDGTGNGGKEITGIDALVPQDPTTGTVGGINRATWTFWRSKLVDPGSTPTSTTLLGHMNDLWNQCTRGTDHPNLILSGSTIFNTFEQVMQPLQRFAESKMAEAGFTAYRYKGADVVLENGSGMVATDMVFLNTKYIKYRPHTDRNMVPLDPSRRYATNQDAAVVILGWAGNMTLSNSRVQGRLKGD
jgi:hypothetical protein